MNTKVILSTKNHRLHFYAAGVESLEEATATALEFVQERNSLDGEEVVDIWSTPMEGNDQRMFLIYKEPLRKEKDPILIEDNDAKNLCS